MSRALALVGLIAGCWTSARTVPAEPVPEPAQVAAVHHRTPPRSPCEITVDHLTDIYRDELSKIPDFIDNLDAIRDVAVVSCGETHWSSELMHCFTDTVDNTALAECQSLFTTEQTTDLMRRISEVMTGQNAPPPISP